MKRSFFALVVTAALGLASGCAPLARGAIVRTSDEVTSSRHQTAPSRTPIATISQDGDVFAVDATWACDATRIDSIDRTTEFELEMSGSVRTTTLTYGIIGALSVATGAPMVVDPDWVSSRTGTEMNPVTMRVTGGFLIAGGLTLATIAIADLIRAGGTDIEHERFDAPPEVITRGTECDQRYPASDREIALALSSMVPQRVGHTDMNGRFAAQISTLVPRTRLLGSAAEVVTNVQVDGLQVGTLDLIPAREALAQQAGSLLDLDACARRRSESTCRPLINFVRDFPSSTQAARVQETLTAVAEQLQAEQAEAEARRQAAIAEAERQRQAYEAEARRAQAEYETRMRADEQRLRAEAAERDRVAAQRQQCRQNCARACAGQVDCQNACVRDTCH